MRGRSMPNRLLVVGFVATLMALTGCTDDQSEVGPVDRTCSVEIVRIEFGADASADEVNRVFRAVADVEGVRVAQRAEPLGSAPRIDVTVVDGVGETEVVEIASSAADVERTETVCAGD